MVSEKMLLRSRMAAEKRFPRYQKILCDHNNRYALILDMINEEIYKAMQKYQHDTIEYLAGTLWHTLLLERESLFENLISGEYKQVSEHQRGYYATLRFCMETVADLDYLRTHPKELKRFLTDDDKIDAEIRRIRGEDISELEKDEKLAELTMKGKINSSITERIAESFPGFAQDYGLFCMYTHLSMRGLSIFCSPSAVDLLIEKTTLITREVFETMIMILDELEMLNEEADILSRNVDRVMLECEQKVTNLYYGKNDAGQRFSDERLTEMHAEFCNRKANLCPEPESAKQES